MDLDKFQPREAALRWLNADGFQQPLLLSGGTAELLTIISEQLALAAACLESHEAPCGTCRGCKQAQQKTHPDILIYNTERASIPIADMRSLLANLGRKSVSFRRLIVIHDAHKLTNESANKLLKALEEPAAATRFLLLTKWPRRLLATILSRCQHLKLPTEQNTSTETDFAMPQRLYERLVKFGGKERLDAATLTAMSQALSKQLREAGPSSSLRLAFQRLRDYYTVTAANGNERAARDVLLGAWF